MTSDRQKVDTQGVLCGRYNSLTCLSVPTVPKELHWWYCVNVPTFSSWTRHYKQEPQDCLSSTTSHVSTITSYHHVMRSPRFSPSTFEPWTQSNTGGLGMRLRFWNYACSKHKPVHACMHYWWIWLIYTSKIYHTCIRCPASGKSVPGWRWYIRTIGRSSRSRVVRSEEDTGPCMCACVDGGGGRFM